MAALGYSLRVPDQESLFYFKDNLKPDGVLGLAIVTQHLLNLVFIPFLLIPGSWKLIPVAQGDGNALKLLLELQRQLDK